MTPAVAATTTTKPPVSATTVVTTKPSASATTAKPSLSATTVAGAKPLARTGSDSSIPLARIGIFLVALGSGVGYFARRRRQSIAR